MFFFATCFLDHIISLVRKAPRIQGLAAVFDDDDDLLAGLTKNWCKDPKEQGVLERESQRRRLSL